MAKFGRTWKTADINEMLLLPISQKSLMALGVTVLSLADEDAEDQRS